MRRFVASGSITSAKMLMLELPGYNDGDGVDETFR